jgi:iron complex outermembrane recepter protein
LSPPKPTTAKTYQAGSVLKFNRFTLEADGYHVHFQNGYQQYIDPATNEPVFVATGHSNTKGLEAESYIVLGLGFSLYRNGSLGSVKYQTGRNYPNGGLWVASIPGNIEAASLLYQHRNWDLGFTNKRVGSMYNDNGSLTYVINGIKIPYPIDQAIKIDPFNLTNVFANYTIKNSSRFRGTKIQFAANNLADHHNIVGITPATAATATAPDVSSPNDQLNLLPGRSFSITVTGGWAPKR